MYKICKTEQSAERQKEFQKTLLSMMEHKSYKKITITALCDEMGVPRKAFYRYFDEMDDVLESFLDDIILNSFLLLDAGKVEFGKYFSFWKENKKLLDLLKTNQLENMLIERGHAIVSTSLPESMGEIVRLRVLAQISAVMTMVITWHNTGMKLSTEEMEEVARTMACTI